MMHFEKLQLPGLATPTLFPREIHISFPANSSLPPEQQHFLITIPWEDSYLELVPAEYRAFFRYVLPYLAVRTTDVHTAVSLSYLDQLVHSLATSLQSKVNRRVVALALILHDSGWSQLTEAEIAASLGVQGLQLNITALGPKEKHAIESEKIARKVLAECVFDPPLMESEIELICAAVRLHDKPIEVAGAGNEMPLEVQLLVDLDHLWSFTQLNFWQDTLRKGVAPVAYVKNLAQDLDDYFVTNEGKALATSLLHEREAEVLEWQYGPQPV